jgi:hypothetical protein
MHATLARTFPAARTAPARACRGWSNDAVPVDKRRRGLLTKKKTVIRFRAKQTLLRKRVSQNNTTTRSTKRTSARTIKTVDAGFVSFAKRSDTSNTGTRDASRRGFFIAARLAPAHRIRPGAPGASAVGRGSDSRDVASNWAVLAKQVH